MHSLESLNDPTGLIPPLPGIDDQIRTSNTRALKYTPPDVVYANIAETVMRHDTTWDGEPLSSVVQRAISFQPSVDLDVPSEGRDVLGQAAAMEIRSQVVHMLNADRRKP